MFFSEIIEALIWLVLGNVSIVLSLVALILSIFAFRKLKKIEKLLELETGYQKEKLGNLNVDANEKVELVKAHGLSALTRKAKTTKLTVLNEDATTKTSGGEHESAGFFVSLLEWMRKDSLMKIGVFFVFIATLWAFIFFVKEGLIGPRTIITLGFILSAALMIFGVKDALVYKTRGLTMFGLGAAISLVDLYVAVFAYNLIPKELGLLILVVILGSLVYTSLMFNSRVLIFFSSILAAFIPFIVSESTIGFYTLFAHFAAIALVTSIIVWKKDWHFLHSLLFLEYFVYSSYAYGTIDNLTEYSAFTILLFPLLFVINHTKTLINFETNNSSASKDNISGLIKFYSVLTVLNILFISAWTEVFFKDMSSALLIMWGSVFLFIAFVAQIRYGAVLPFVVHGLSSLVLVAIVILKEFGLRYLYASIIFEALVALFAAVLLLKHEKFTHKVARFIVGFLGIPAIVYSVLIFDAHNKSDFIEYLANIILYGFAVILALWFIRHKFPNVKEQEFKKVFFSALPLLATFFILIWSIPHSGFIGVNYLRSAEQATWISMVIYTLIGVILYNNKFKNTHYHKIAHQFGRFLLAIVAVWVLLLGLDISNVIIKVALFATVGTLFIYTAYKRKNAKIKNSDNDKESQNNNR